MDLEAPGIHYKFFGDAAGKIKGTKGVVDYINYYLNENIPPPDIEPYLLRYNENISIMPSGDVTSDDYWQNLSRVNWHALLYDKESSGIKLLVDMLERIKNYSDNGNKYDFILIDSRAGITPLSGLCASLLGDVLAVFFSASHESLDGTRQMLKKILDTKNTDNLPNTPIISVLTRFEMYDDNEHEEAFIHNKFDYLCRNINPTQIKRCVIHSNREIERNERVIYNMEEITKENDLPIDAPIQLYYLRFFSALIDDNLVSKRAEILLNNLVHSSKLLNDPEKIQSEVESLASVYPNKQVLEQLIKFYIMRNINSLDLEKFITTLTRFYNAGGSNDYFDSYYINAFVKYYDDLESIPIKKPIFEQKKILEITKIKSQEVPILARHILTIVAKLKNNV
jgi:cellulose biosynthesis protein BcsQ